MVRRLVGGDDVEPSVLERQAGRIRGQKRTSVRSPAAVRASAICCGSTSTPTAYAERIGDEQRRGAVAAADVQYDQLRWTGTWRRRRTAFSYSAAVPDVVDETLFDSCHSHGIAPRQVHGSGEPTGLIVERASSSRIDADGQYH